MSLQLLKERKMRAIQSALERDTSFMFSEGLSEAFKVDGKPYKVDNFPLIQNDSDHLEPIITLRDSIQPIMTKDVEDVEMSEVEQTTNETTKESSEDMTDLLDAIDTFSLSSSQIPVQQKSVALEDLVKLSLSNLKTVIASVDFKSWSSEVVGDLFKKIAETENIPSANSALLIRSAILDKICDLNTSAPRLLMNSILSLAKEDGKPMLDGLIIPLLFYSDLGRPQIEIINKIISDCLNASQRSTLLQVILSEGEMYSSDSDSFTSPTTRKYLKPWNDNIFQILSSILNSRPLITLNKTDLFGMLQPIQSVVQTNPKDKSSMQFLLLLTSKYPQALVEFEAIDTIEGICKISTMFLKNSVLRQINSIKKNISTLQK